MPKAEARIMECSTALSLDNVISNIPATRIMAPYINPNILERFQQIEFNYLCQISSIPQAVPKKEGLVDLSKDKSLCLFRAREVMIWVK